MTFVTQNLINDNSRPYIIITDEECSSAAVGVTGTIAAIKNGEQCIGTSTASCTGDNLNACKPPGPEQCFFDDNLTPKCQRIECGHYAWQTNGILCDAVVGCTAQSTTRAILANSSHSSDDHYYGWTIEFTMGNGTTQTSRVTSYVGSTKEVVFIALANPIYKGLSYKLSGRRALGLQGQLNFVNQNQASLSVSPGIVPTTRETGSSPNIMKFTLNANVEGSETLIMKCTNVAVSGAPGAPAQAQGVTVEVLTSGNAQKNPVQSINGRAPAIVGLGSKILSLQVQPTFVWLMIHPMKTTLPQNGKVVFTLPITWIPSSPSNIQCSFGKLGSSTGSRGTDNNCTATVSTNEITVTGSSTFSVNAAHGLGIKLTHLTPPTSATPPATFTVKTLDSNNNILEGPSIGNIPELNASPTPNPAPATGFGSQILSLQAPSHIAGAVAGIVRVTAKPLGSAIISSDKVRFELPAGWTWNSGGSTSCVATRMVNSPSPITVGAIVITGQEIKVRIDEAVVHDDGITVTCNNVKVPTVRKAKKTDFGVSIIRTSGTSESTLVSSTEGTIEAIKGFADDVFMLTPENDGYGSVGKINLTFGPVVGGISQGEKLQITLPNGWSWNSGANSECITTIKGSVDGDFNVCYGNGSSISEITCPSCEKLWNRLQCVPDSSNTLDQTLCTTHCTNAAPASCPASECTYNYLSVAGGSSAKCLKNRTPYWRSDGDESQKSPTPEEIVATEGIVVLRSPMLQGMSAATGYQMILNKGCDRTGHNCMHHKGVVAKTFYGCTVSANLFPVSPCDAFTDTYMAIELDRSVPNCVEGSNLVECLLQNTNDYKGYMLRFVKGPGAGQSVTIGHYEGNNSNKASFLAAHINGSFPVAGLTEYELWFYRNGTGQVFVVTGLSGNEGVQIRTKGTNAEGATPWTSPMEPNMGAGPPNQPTIVSVIPQRLNTGVIKFQTTWLCPYNGGSNITRFVVAVDGNETSTEIGKDCIEGQNLTLQHGHFTSDGQFEVRVKADTAQSRNGEFSEAAAGIICKAGEYRNTSGTGCVPCPLGTYNPHLASTRCTPCSLGSYCPNSGMTSPTTCRSGALCSNKCEPRDCTGNIKISNITKGVQTLITTTVSHGFVDGNFVFISNVMGMTSINNHGRSAYKVEKVNNTSFKIKRNTDNVYIDSSQWQSHVNLTGIVSKRTVSSSACTGNNQSHCVFNPTSFTCTASVASIDACNTGNSSSPSCARVAGVSCDFTTRTETEATSEQFCPAGFYCPQGALSQLRCTLGDYCPAGAFRHTVANPCPDGHYCPTPEQAISCGSGFYCKTNSGDTQLTRALRISEAECPDNYFCDTPSIKIPCAAGTWCTSQGTCRNTGMWTEQTGEKYVTQTGTGSADWTWTGGVGDCRAACENLRECIGFNRLTATAPNDANGNCFGWKRDSVKISDDPQMTRYMRPAGTEVLKVNGVHSVDSISVTTAGNDYSAGSVVFSGGSCTRQPSASFSINPNQNQKGPVNSVTVMEGGHCTALPTSAIINDPGSGTGVVLAIVGKTIQVPVYEQLCQATSGLSWTSGSNVWNQVSGTVESSSSTTQLTIATALSYQAPCFNCPANYNAPASVGYFNDKKITIGGETRKVTSYTANRLVNVDVAFSAQPTSGTAFTIGWCTDQFGNTFTGSGLLNSAVDCYKNRYYRKFSQPCPAGYACSAFSVSPAVRILCPRGTYCPEAEGTDRLNPSACPADFYCPKTSTKVACAAGFFCQVIPYNVGGNFKERETPKACPVGFECPTAGATPIACPAGYFCPLGTINKQHCPGGTFCVTSNRSEQCPMGTYCKELSDDDQSFVDNPDTALQGRTSAQDCPSGFYCPTPASSVPCSVVPDPHEVGLAQAMVAPASDKILLASSSSAVNDFYKNRIINYGGESGEIIGYDGATKIATIQGFNNTAATGVQYSILFGAPPSSYCKTSPGGPISTRTSAAICPAGFRCPDASTKIACVAGELCLEGTGGNTSPKCPVGYFCSSTGAANQKKPLGTCAAKFFCVEGLTAAPGGGVQANCAAGKYCPHLATQVEVPCSQGDYCPVGSSNPIDCPLGFYCTSPSDKKPCLFDATIVDLVITSANQGWLCKPRSTTPVQCPAGFYCDGSHQYSCDDVSKDAVKDESSPIVSGTAYYCPAGTRSPIVCAAGSYCPTSSEQIICPEGQGLYCPEGSFNKRPCPTAHYCRNVRIKTPCNMHEYCPEYSMAPSRCPDKLATTNGEKNRCICPVSFYAHLGLVDDYEPQQGSIKLDNKYFLTNYGMPATDILMENVKNPDTLAISCAPCSEGMICLKENLAFMTKNSTLSIPIQPGYWQNLTYFKEVPHQAYLRKCRDKTGAIPIDSGGANTCTATTVMNIKETTDTNPTSTSVNSTSVNATSINLSANLTVTNEDPELHEACSGGLNWQNCETGYYGPLCGLCDAEKHYVRSSDEVSCEVCVGGGNTKGAWLLFYIVSTFTFFLSLCLLTRPPPLAEVDSSHLDLHGAFFALDINGDGVVKSEELIRNLRKKGMDRRLAYLMVNEIDKDGDGTVSYSEWVRVIHHEKTMNKTIVKKASYAPPKRKKSRRRTSADLSGATDTGEDLINDLLAGGGAILSRSAMKLNERLGLVKKKSEEELAEEEEKDANTTARALGNAVEAEELSNGALSEALHAGMENAEALLEFGRTLKEDVEQMIGTLRQVVSHMQVVSQLDFSLGIEFPTAFEDLFRAFKAINLDFLNILIGFDACNFSTSYANRFYVHMAMLPFFIFILLSAWIICRLWKKFHPAVQFTNLSITDNSIRFLNIIVFCVYPSLSTRIFRVFNSFEINGRRYLRDDATVEADWSNPSYRTLAFISMTFILIYVIGIPVLYVMILSSRRRYLINAKALKRHRDRKMLIRDKTYHRTTRVYGSLFISYEETFWYYECVELLRKAVLTGFLSLAGTAQERCVLGVLLVVLFAMIAFNTRPYEADVDDVLQQLLLVVLFFIFFSGLLISTNISSKDNVMLGSVLVVSNVAVILFGFMLMMAILPCIRRPLVALFVKCSKLGKKRKKRTRVAPVQHDPWRKSFSKSKEKDYWMNEDTGEISWIDPHSDIYTPTIKAKTAPVVNLNSNSGVTKCNVTGSLFTAFTKMKNGPGAKIKNFRPEKAGGSPVERAGAKIGDHLVSLNGLDMSQLEYHTILENLKKLTDDSKALVFASPENRSTVAVAKPIPKTENATLLTPQTANAAEVKSNKDATPTKKRRRRKKRKKIDEDNDDSSIPIVDKEKNEEWNNGNTSVPESGNAIYLCLSSASASSTLSSINPSKLEIHKTSAPKAKPKNESLEFGKVFTDHMLEIDWDVKNGWAAPQIKPYGDVLISPASSALHYGLQCFEGMKAYRDSSGDIRLFRPDCNMERLNSSMERLFLPTFDGDKFLECIKELIKLDKDWVPEGEGYSLYIRPTGISTQPTLGVGQALSARLFCILSPVGPYFPEGVKPVKLFANSKNARAFPGGTGNVKVGGNYGATIGPQLDAARMGFSQVLWLFGEKHQVTEVGVMNLFVLWEKADGSGLELVTAPLDGTILPGVTRRSVLDLARKWKLFDVSERVFYMKDLTDAIEDGRIVEAFGVGTAAVVSPIELIHYENKDYIVPLDKNDSNASIGKVAKRVLDELTDIQYGKIPAPDGWSVKI
eukprot:g4063.t1